MPKTSGKAFRSAKAKNERVAKEVLVDDTAFFGRTIKSLGNCRFRIQTTDEDGRPTEAEAVIGGRSVVRINIGDIVIVGRNKSAGRITYEIVGSCDKKTIKKLREVTRLHSSLLDLGGGLDDDIFDHSGDVGDEEEEAKDTKEKKQSAAGEDEDLDVDAI